MRDCVLITGGAGFVGSNLAVLTKTRFPNTRIIAMDNLKRRGSELTLERLKDHGIEFIHGDIRNREDLDFSGESISLIIECSAEPSVMAGYNSAPYYVLDTNLTGAINCFELARTRGADIVFLSTSRVYPVEALNGLRFEESDTRFSLLDDQPVPGASAQGISARFPLEGYRTLYGATKLAAEIILKEYIHMYGIQGLINRCGVIAGPWQMGKVDQGVFSLWMLHHYFKKDLKYTGFGGSGKQVRDLLHVEDLFELICVQVDRMDNFNGQVYNVGGGVETSLSLLETTELCRKMTGNTIDFGHVRKTHPSDIRIYVSDNRDVASVTDWHPRKNTEAILTDIYDWIRQNEEDVKKALL